MIIDSHCHLDYEPMSSSIDNVILRAKKNHVKYLLTISTEDKNYSKILKIDRDTVFNVREVLAELRLKITYHTSLCFRQKKNLEYFSRRWNLRNLLLYQEFQPDRRRLIKYSLNILI